MRDIALDSSAISEASGGRVILAILKFPESPADKPQNKTFQTYIGRERTPYETNQYFR
jgi:hypothetical protein